MMNPATEIQLSPGLSNWATKSWLVRLSIRLVLVPAILFSTARLFSPAPTKAVLVVQPVVQAED